MDTEILKRHFARIGAEVQVEVVPDQDRRFRAFSSTPARDYILDIRQFKRDEYFVLTLPESRLETLEAFAVQVNPQTRHLLLMVKNSASGAQRPKRKFLCGHDERHWFIAGCPDNGHFVTINDALEALKPTDVLKSLQDHRVRAKDRNRRRNAGYVRQGEWFFLPCPNFAPQDRQNVLRNEPITRGRGKAHLLEFAYRTGGEPVYVNNRYPNGLTPEQYKDLLNRNPDAAKWNWRMMTRNAEVYALGNVRHPDHYTLTLSFWHRVLMSLERQDQAVAFLD